MFHITNVQTDLFYPRVIIIYNFWHHAFLGDTIIRSSNFRRPDGNGLFCSDKATKTSFFSNSAT